MARWTPGGAIGWGVVVLLLPKCPACIVGYLSLLGMSVGVGSVIAGAVKPAFIAMAILALALFLRRRLG